MKPTKKDFTSCFDADLIFNFYEWEYVSDQEPDAFQEAQEEQFTSFLLKCGLIKKPSKAGLNKEEKLLTTSKNKVRKTLPVRPKLIIFNKSKMAKYPDIELDTSTIFESLFDLMLFMTSDEVCRKHLEKLRWGGEPICPHCGSQRNDHYSIKTRGEDRGRFKCKDCRLPFSVTVGTIFEKSTVPLRKWFLAIYLLTSHKKGISSKQLGRDIKVTQKTAWFMLSRLRNSFANKTDFQFEGIVQMDETYVGGKNLNKIKEKRQKKTQGRSLSKTPVFGMLSDGLVFTQVVPDTTGKTLRPIVRDKVVSSSLLVTDGWKAYRKLSDDYRHVVIPHNRGMYKFGPYHTNSIEGFWSLLKRGLLGIYHATSPKHLHKYCDEFSFRYNTRHMGEGERFNLALINSDERLTFKELTGE